MKSNAAKSWLWLVVGLLWGVMIGLFTLAHREPLTGWSARTHLLFSAYQGVMIGFAAYCFWNLKWRLAASIVTLVAIFFAVPLPSMAGLKLELQNDRSTNILVKVARSDRPNRQIDFRLTPNTSLTYQTAAGDWPGSAGLVISCESSKISATIMDMRNKKTLFTTNGIVLVAVTPSVTTQSGSNNAVRP